jgi:extradiol dioxygenase family protein
MPVQLNHTIVDANDKHDSATFLAEILGLRGPTSYGPFLVVQVDNDVSLDFAGPDHGPVHPQHYAFLVGEAEFDEIFGRITERGLSYWADPFHRQPGEINHNDGGRGVYWDDPNGHALEIITRPYGSGG